MTFAMEEEERGPSHIKSTLIELWRRGYTFLETHLGMNVYAFSSFGFVASVFG